MNDVVATLSDQRRLDELRRVQETDTARRAQQQIIEDEERHSLERKAARAPKLVQTAPRPDRPDRDDERSDAPTSDEDAPEGKAAVTASATEKHPADGAAGVGPIAFLIIALVAAGLGFVGWRFYGGETALATQATADVSSKISLLPPIIMAVPTDANDRSVSIDLVLPSASAASSIDLTGADNASPLHAPEGLPEPVATTQAPSLPSAEALAAKSLAAANEERVAALSARLHRLETTLVEMQDRIPAKVQAVSELAKATKPEPVPERPKPAVARTERPPAKATTPTIHGNQLLAIDIWNGVPSVVVGTGLPGDKRVKVLKQGDVYNDIVLLSVNPAARTATFRLRTGRSLTLSVNEGG